MEKIPTLFIRDPENRSKLTVLVNPECKWVVDGEGVGRRKWDGTCVMLGDNCRWWARREVKKGKPFPDEFVFVSFDEVTGKTMGWVPIEESSFYGPHLEVLDREPADAFEPGTYELIGPKINGNPENRAQHELIRHDTSERVDLRFNHFSKLEPERWLQIRTYFEILNDLGMEGVVWTHPDGRMAKLKCKDFRFS